MEKEGDFNDTDATRASEFSIIKKGLLLLKQIIKFGWNIRIKIKPINSFPGGIPLA